MSEEKKKPHTHHQHPSRCCSDEPAQEVLDRLRANAPVRLGYRTNNGWSGESEDEFSIRVRAWRSALKREEETLRAAR